LAAEAGTEAKVLFSRPIGAFSLTEDKHRRLLCAPGVVGPLDYTKIVTYNGAAYSVLLYFFSVLFSCG
jgi:hypothetical protein